MTIQIPFHEYDVESCHEDVQYYAERLQRYICNLGNPKMPRLTLRDIADTAINYAGLLSQFRPCTYDTANALRAAAYAWDYAFILGRYPSQDHQEEVFIPPSEPLLLPTTGPRGYLTAGQWVYAFHLACICRDPRINDSLCKYPTERLREASKHGVSSPEYCFVHVEMLKAFWRKDSTLNEYFMQAYETTIHEQEEVFIDYALNIASYEIQLFAHLHTEPEKFSEVLAEALERYQKHMFLGEEGRVNNSKRFLSIGLLAMCSIAYMRDIPIGVESGYIPRCIIKDQYQEHPDDVICEAWATRTEWKTQPPAPDTTLVSTDSHPRIRQEIEIPLESLPPEKQEQFSRLEADLAESQGHLDDLEQSFRQP